MWLSYRSPTVPTTQLNHDIETDVVVLGMGISGAMIAEALTARGMSVVVIDRRGPLKGSTLATTALVQFEIDQPVTRLTKMIGRTAAEQAWRRSRLAVDNLSARIAELGINRDVTTRQSLYLAGNMLGPGQLQKETEARRQAGIYATLLSRTALAEAFGIDRKGAILSHGNLAIDPRKLTSGLLLKALSRNARLYAPVEATAIKDARDEVVIATKRGPSITAKQVILATGYELTDLVPTTNHTVLSTWAIATRPQQRALWPGESFIWEASEPYLYIRTTADGRVICGGEDEYFTDASRRDGKLMGKSARLSEKLGKLLPKLDTTPEFAWTAAFGSTSTGLPYIGALPRHPRIHAVMGYGGNGITYSQIASEIISASLCGQNDTDARLFAFNR